MHWTMCIVLHILYKHPFQHRNECHAMFYHANILKTKPVLQHSMCAIIITIIKQFQNKSKLV